MNKNFYTGLLCVIFIIVLYIYWYFIRPRHYENLYQILKQFKGFKKSHLTNKEEEHEFTPPVTNTNSHMLIYGSSESGKTSFLKYYLDQTKCEASKAVSIFIVFGRDENEFNDNYIPLWQLENIEIEKLANRTIFLDDAGAYKNLRTKVEDLFRFGRHHNIQVIFLAHHAKDVLPVVRENCFKIFITINNPDSFFETIVSTYSIPKELCLNEHWKQYRSLLEFGVIEFDTRSQKYKTLNHNYQVVYDTTKHICSPEYYVKHESYFFTGEEYNKLKVF